MARAAFDTTEPASGSHASTSGFALGTHAANVVDTMANRRGPSILEKLSFGGRIPWGVGLILTVTIASSLMVAFGSRHVLPLFELCALAPERVFRAELWRLVTWSVIEPGPISLVFGCLMLYWFGRDLAAGWGSRRFLSVYFGIAMAAAIGTCLIGLVDKAVLPQEYVGNWPLAEAMTIAWGLTYPDRIIRIYFVILIKGYTLAWLTLALTVVYAVYSGWEHYLPNLLAEGSMLAWMYRSPLTRRWSDWRRTRMIAAQTARVARAKKERQMASVHVLRKIEEKDDDLEPLSPELEGKLGRLFGEPQKDGRTKRDDDEKPN